MFSIERRRVGNRDRSDSQKSGFLPETRFLQGSVSRIAVFDSKLLNSIAFGEIVFLKLVRREIPQYIRSQEFVLENPHDLDRVLQVLKQLAALAAG